MREILFRGKNVLDGQWHYGSLQTFKGFSIFDASLKQWHTVRGETIGQYTGLTDKNGRRIFEGDILKEDYRFGGKHVLHVVMFEGSSFGTKRFVSGKLSNICIPFDDCENPMCTERETEVIGNIHDTPELLQEAK